MDIAGNGTLFDMLSDFIKENNLSEKIHMEGLVEHSNMEEFWIQHDIAVNLSECEGCSMAMVESMAAGAIPVFTDVFSTRYFIKDKINGFVVDFNDIQNMADCIFYLDKNRDKLINMGTKAHNTILQKCKMQDYLEYINKNIYIK